MTGNRPTAWLLSILACAVVAAVVFSTAPALPVSLAEMVEPRENRTFYVSKLGSNTDGRSWATAWNELSQINWASVQPGDTVLLDGGTQQMVYTSTLSPRVSGTATAPITIRLAAEPDRNGQVVIFGGRSTLLPYCDQVNYVYQTANVRKTGIEIEAVAWLIIDGTKWRGIAIHGHNRAGIGMGLRSAHITVRNVEVFDNGSAVLNDDAGSERYNTWYPDQQGIVPNGSDNTIERAIIHDNGQDALQSGGGIHNLTVRLSWLYNGRTHPLGPDIPWNYCQHSDGIQLYAGGVQEGLTIDSSIVGPGFMQGTILGSSGESVFSQLNRVTIRNSLFINNYNANIMAYDETDPQGWVVEHNTIYSNRNTNHDILGGYNWALQIQGSGHRIANNVIYDGRLLAPGATSSDNCTFNVLSGTIGGAAVDPQLAAPPVVDSPTIQDSIEADYALLPCSPCEGKGASITSVSKLLGQTTTY